MKTLALLILIAPAFAFADLTGRWEGAGEWLFDGQGPECAMALDFRESATELKRLGGFFNCGIVTLRTGPATWTKRGEDLLVGDDVIGRRTAETLETVEAPEPGSKVRVHTKIVETAGRLKYEEVWIGEDGRQIYLIHGEFERR